jgi:drug/metabolite transporter (DMT)-like permease
VLLCLAAAAGYSLSSVLQQRAAAAESRRYSLRPSLLLRLVRRPLWLTGKAVDVLATVLQAVAIHLGSVVLVEPLLASGLLFALPLGARIAGRRLETRDWLGALALTGGLALFVAMTGSTGGRNDASVAVWLTAGAIVAVLVVMTIATFRDDARPHRAAWLAGAGGLLYACSATLTKPATHAWTAGPGALATSWQLYALLAVSFVAATAVQSAFQMGSIVASLPALTAVEPVAGVALGVCVLGEHLATGPRSLPPLAVAFAAMLAGIVVLARSPLVAASHDAPAHDRCAAEDEQPDVGHLHAGDVEVGPIR